MPAPWNISAKTAGCCEKLGFEIPEEWTPVNQMDEPVTVAGSPIRSPIGSAVFMTIMTRILIKGRGNGTPHDYLSAHAE